MRWPVLLALVLATALAVPASSADGQEDPLRPARTYLDRQQPDGAIAALRDALGAGAEQGAVAQLAAMAVYQAYRTAAASDQRDGYERAIQLARRAADVAPSPQAKFLLGVASLRLAEVLLRDNRQRQSCDDAHAAQEALITAQLSLPAGGSFQQDATKRLIASVDPYRQATAGQIARYCR